MIDNNYYKREYFKRNYYINTKAFMINNYYKNEYFKYIYLTMRNYLFSICSIT